MVDGTDLVDEVDVDDRLLEEHLDLLLHVLALLRLQRLVELAELRLLITGSLQDLPSNRLVWVQETTLKATVSNKQPSWERVFGSKIHLNELSALDGDGVSLPASLGGAGTAGSAARDVESVWLVSRTV